MDTKRKALQGTKSLGSYIFNAQDIGDQVLQKTEENTEAEILKASDMQVPDWISSAQKEIHCAEDSPKPSEKISFKGSFNPAKKMHKGGLKQVSGQKNKKSIKPGLAAKTQLRVYPKQFGEKEIKYFEILASKLTSCEKKNLGSKNQRKSYSKYEDALICLAPSLNIGPSELADIFRSNPYCSERSLEALDRRRYVLNSKGVLDKLFRKTAKQIYGEIKGISFKKSVRQAGKAAAAVFGKKEAAQSVLFDDADPEEKEIRPLKEQEERKKENEITETSDKSYTYYTYPDRFTQEDINRLEDILAGRREARFEEKGVTRRTKMSYTEYDRDFLLTCIERGYKFEDIFTIFGDNPFLTPRKYEGLKAKFYEYRKASDISGYKGHMEKEYARARVPEDKSLPKTGPRCINTESVEPCEKKVSVAPSIEVLDRHICEFRNKAAINAVLPFEYESMKTNVKLYEYCRKHSRRVYSSGHSLVYISDLAAFWGIGEEEATERIDTMCDNGLPFKRDEHEVYFISDTTNTGKLEHFEITDVEQLSLGYGVTCTPVGILSDTHYGAKDCAHELVDEFYERAYNNFGVRCFLHAGDFFNGESVFKGQSFENNWQGFDQQLGFAADNYPYKHGALTYAILGNHDESFIKLAGGNIINALSLKRHDIVPIGIYQGMVTINGFHINLHHVAGSGGSKNPWGKINKICAEKQQMMEYFDIKELDLVIMGHLHRNEILSCFGDMSVKTVGFGGSFQRSNPFARRMGAVKGMIGGYVANLYTLPDMRKHVEIVPISVDEKCRKVIPIRKSNLCGGKKVA